MTAPAGTNVPLPRFPEMRIREEDCNLVLLTMVVLFTLAIAGGAALLEPVSSVEKKPVYLADQTVGNVAPSAGKQSVNLADPGPVRVIGTPFVPNTNPRER